MKIVRSGGKPPLTLMSLKFGDTFVIKTNGSIWMLTDGPALDCADHICVNIDTGQYTNMAKTQAVTKTEGSFIENYLE